MTLSTVPKKWKIPIGILLVAGAAYLLDELSWRISVPSRPQYSTYTIRQYYYINENFNKFSVESAGQAPEQCVNALMPHAGLRPCWYVKGHTRNMIHVN